MNQSASDHSLRQTKVVSTTGFQDLHENHLSSSTPRIPDLQRCQYSEGVQRTSTPRIHTHETPRTDYRKTPQRPQPAPRRKVQRNENIPHQSPRPRPTQQNSLNNNSRQIFIIGDSLISSINTKGLRQNIFKYGFPGAKINNIFD